MVRELVAVGGRSGLKVGKAKGSISRGEQRPGREVKRSENEKGFRELEAKGSGRGKWKG